MELAVQSDTHVAASPNAAWRISLASRPASAAGGSHMPSRVLKVTYLGRLRARVRLRLRPRLRVRG